MVAVAVSLGEFQVFISPPRLPSLTSYAVVIILALTVTVLIVKLRQRRKRRVNTSRRRRNYSRTSDELVAAREQQPYEHVWRGPYASRASYTRSPSPVSKHDVIYTFEFVCVLTRWPPTALPGASL